MAVKAGFGGLAVNNFGGGWVPFRISLTNDGDPVSGKLIVRTEYQSNVQGREFSVEVQLPTGSRQFYEIPAYINSSQKDPTVSLVSRDGSVAAAASVKVERQSFGWNDRLDVAVVDSDSATLSAIASAQIARPTGRDPFKAAPGSDLSRKQDQDNSQEAPPPLPQQGRGRNRGGFGQQQPAGAQPIVIQTEDLPRDAVSYDPTNAVVLGDQPLSQLTSDQARALRLWIAAGGLLIATGATDAAGLKTSALDDVLPVDLKGNSTAASLPALNAAYGPFDTADTLLIMSSRLRPGAELLMGTAELPLVAERIYGSGLVRFVAINPKLNPYRSWSGSKALWNDLLLPAADASAKRMPSWMSGRRSSRGGLQNVLFKLAGIEPLSSSYFLFFLLVYIVVVGPLNYIVLRLVKKLDLAWLTIPAVVILFTTAGVTFAQFSRGWDSTSADASVVEIYQSEGVERVSGALLFSPNSKGKHEIKFNGHDTAVNESSNQSADPFELERAGSGVLLRVEMNKWTHGMMNTRTIRDGARPVASIEKTAVGNIVSVKNISAAALNKAVILTPLGASAAFDLMPGETKQIDVSRPKPGTFSSWYETQLSGDAEAGSMLGDVEDRFDAEAEVAGFSSPGGAAGQQSSVARRKSGPILIGFTETSPLTVEFGGPLRRKSKTLYLIHL